jgi:hypothetical protein
MSPCIEYVPRSFSDRTLEVLEAANVIIAEYEAQGFDLTLRQLYYQFVARGLIANRQSEYKRLGSIVNDGRLAGIIDWERITDRTRNLEGLPHWGSPRDMVRACEAQFRTERWAGQPVRVEVWIEKEALAGVFARVCNQLDVPYFCCRGYTSQSEMWAAAQRFIAYERAGQSCVLLHFGDHDPSGIDMTRDIAARLALFEADVTVRRLALNIGQVRRYNPPPNPAKETDSRHAGYLERFGDESWELDALDPKVLSHLVREAVDEVVDNDAWNAAAEADELGRRQLDVVARRWADVTQYIAGLE